MVIIILYIIILTITFIIFYFFKNGKISIYQKPIIPISMISTKIKNDTITYISRSDCFSFYSPHLVSRSPSRLSNFNMNKTMDSEAAIFSRSNSLDDNRNIQDNEHNQVVHVPIKLLKVSKVIPHNNIQEIPIDFRQSGPRRRKRLFVFMTKEKEFHKTNRCYNLEDPEPILLSDAINLKLKPCPLCF